MPAQQETTLSAAVVGRLFEIPDYQRPYAWERKQLEDLWEDLDLMGPRGQHYFGTLVMREIRDDSGVVISLDSTGTELHHCEVIDGQQRLTTCALLLDRIRRRLDALAASGVEGASEIADNLRRAFGIVTVDKASVPRVRLGSAMADYWVNIVLGDEDYPGNALISGEDRVRRAALFFEQKLDQLGSEADPSTVLERLRDLQRRITAGLRLLVYEVSTAAEVGVIFETLNERGRPLSELEKTKNYLLYLARQLPDARQEELAGFINNRWSEIFANLAGQDPDMDDQLLRVHWLATQNAELRSWRRVASIKSRFDRSRYVSGSSRLIPIEGTSADSNDAFDALFHDLKQYVTTLHHCSLFLAEMLDPNASFATFSSPQRARDASAALGRSGVIAVFRPLLCAARLTYPDDGDFYADLVELLECYSARVFVIRQRRVDAGRAKLASLANDLFTRNRTKADVLASIGALMWRYASDGLVQEALESETENWYNRRGHKYFLYEYELSRMSAGEQIPQFSVFTRTGNEQRTTEHILPQNPDADAACWWDVFTSETHVAMRHSLGNLVLTLDNSHYSNKCFADKRGSALTPGASPTPCYSQSSLHQERELATFDEWTPDSIRKRQLALAEWALSRWAVEPPSTSLLEPEEADQEIEPEESDDEYPGEGSSTNE